MEESFTSGTFGEISGGLSKFHDYRRVPFEGAGYSVLYTVISGERKLFLKALNQEQGSSAENLARLYREYKLLERLYGNEHVVRCIGWREDAQIGPCIVMEYVDGETLADYLKASPSHREKKRVLNELLDAMSFIHNHQVVHNDLKLENILVTRNGHNVKLIDFGYADSDSHLDKATGGTKAFAAPELVQQETTDVTSDIYSLGFVIKALFPRRYGGVVRKCQRKEASRRYRNAEEVRRALHSRDVFARVVLFLALVVPLLVWFFFSRIDEEIADQQPIISEELPSVVEEELQPLPEKVPDTVFIVEEHHDTIRVEVPIKPKVEVVRVQVPEGYDIPTTMDLDSLSQDYLDLYERAEQRKAEALPTPFLNNENGLYGFEDKDGKEVIPAIYQEAKAFKYGYALCCLDGKYGFVAPDGSQCLFKYKRINTPPGNRRYYVGSKSGKHYIITFTPLPVEEEYDDVFHENGYAVGRDITRVKKRGRYGYLGEDGSVLEDPILKKTIPYENLKDQKLVIVETDQGWGVVRICFEHHFEHITELKYPFVKEIEGRCFLYGQFERKFGVVTMDGKVGIEEGMYERTDYIRGYSMVIAQTEDGLYSIVDLKNNVIVPKSESIIVSEGVAIIENGGEPQFLKLSTVGK